MPAVVPEASVARAPARSHATGMRPHADADQPSSSPFSELLDGAEPADGMAVDPAATAAEGKPAEGKPAETAPPVAKAEEPEPLKAADGKETAEAPADLLMVMALAGQQPAVEPESKPVTVVAPQPAGSDETQSDTDPLSKTDASDDATVVAQPVPLPAAVPVPTAVPVATEATAPASTPSVPAELAVVADVKTAVSPAIPAASTPDAKLATPASQPAEMTSVEAKPAEAKSIETKPSEAKPAEAKPVESKPVETAPVNTKPIEAPAPERKARAEKPAGAAVKAGTAPSITTEADTTATPAVTTAATKPAADADVSGQKAAERSPETAAITPRGDTEITDAKPKPSAAQLPQDATVNSAALPPPVAHTATPQAAQPVAHLTGPADVVPISGLAVEIAAHAQAGKSHFEIRLDPPELGRIDVRLDIDSDGQVTSHLRVERTETLDLLRRDAPALERALQQAGLKTSDSALQFSLRDQSFSQNQGRDTPAMARIVVPDDAVVPADTQRHYGRLAGLGSGVDIRV